jgi:hypothetical protein
MVGKAYKGSFLTFRFEENEGIGKNYGTRRIKCSGLIFPMI